MIIGKLVLFLQQAMINRTHTTSSHRASFLNSYHAAKVLRNLAQAILQWVEKLLPDNRENHTYKHALITACSQRNIAYLTVWEDLSSFLLPQWNKRCDYQSVDLQKLDLTNFRISLYNRPTTQNGSTCEIGRVTFNVNIYTDQAAASIWSHAHDTMQTADHE